MNCSLHFPFFYGENGCYFQLAAEPLELLGADPISPGVTLPCTSLGPWYNAMPRDGMALRLLLLIIIIAEKKGRLLPLASRCAERAQQHGEQPCMGIPALCIRVSIRCTQTGSSTYNQSGPIQVLSSSWQGLVLTGGRAPSAMK